MNRKTKLEYEYSAALCDFAKILIKSLAGSFCFKADMDFTFLFHYFLSEVQFVATER